MFQYTCDTVCLSQATHSHEVRPDQQPRSRDLAVHAGSQARHCVPQLTQSVESQVAFTVLLLGWPSSSSIRKKLAPGPASMGTAGNSTTCSNTQYVRSRHTTCLVRTHSRTDACAHTPTAGCVLGHAMHGTLLQYCCANRLRSCQTAWSTAARLHHMQDASDKHTWECATCDLHCALPHHHQLVWGDTFPRQDLPCWHKLHLN